MRSHAAAIRAACHPAQGRALLSGSMKRRTPAHERLRVVMRRDWPEELLAAKCEGFCNSHKPMTLRKYRVVPSTPCSFVKLASSAGVRKNWRIEFEAHSDHVPHEI